MDNGSRRALLWTDFVVLFLAKPLRVSERLFLRSLRVGVAGLWSSSRAHVLERLDCFVNDLEGVRPLWQPRIVPTPDHPPPPAQ